MITNMVRFALVLVVSIVTVILALWIFDAMSWEQVKDSLAKVGLLAVLVIASSVLITLINRPK